MMIIAYLVAYVSTAMACSCYPQPAHDAYCYADTVSHVKVTSFSNPNNDIIGMSSVYYGVEHIAVYKKPSSITSLPASVSTPSVEATCGLTLKVGEEYLLSGYFRGDNLRVYLCGQLNDNGFGGLLQWHNVSPALRSNLTTFQC